jgi:DNA-binding HxlR family transcriptional regulator
LYIGFNIGEKILIKVLKSLHAANLIDRRVSAHPFAADEYEIVWLSNAFTAE